MTPTPGTMGTVGHVWVLRNEHTLEIVGVYDSLDAATEANEVIGNRECNIMTFNLIGLSMRPTLDFYTVASQFGNIHIFCVRKKCADAPIYKGMEEMNLLQISDIANEHERAKHRSE